jgi:hypothetical protein
VRRGQILERLLEHGGRQIRVADGEDPHVSAREPLVPPRAPSCQMS